MDIFGIGTALQGATRIYFKSARRTGRTTSMLESLSDGDRVYFPTNQQAIYFEDFAKQRGKKIECRVVCPKHPTRVFDMGTCQGRAVFDHSWLEKFYLEQLNYAEETVDKLQKETSGWGEAHKQTKLKAKELAKWQV